MKEPNTTYKNVDSNSRLVHFFIDTLLIAFIFNIITGSILSLSSLGGTYSLLIYILISLIFYISTEYYFQKSPGKFISRTIVVNPDGSKPSFKQIVLRNISRFIPFDNFSYLVSNRGFHDRIGKTIVSKDI